MLHCYNRGKGLSSKKAFSLNQLYIKEQCRKLLVFSKQSGIINYASCLTSNRAGLSLRRSKVNIKKLRLHGILQKVPSWEIITDSTPKFFSFPLRIHTVFRDSTNLFKKLSIVVWGLLFCSVSFSLISTVTQLLESKGSLCPQTQSEK